MTRNMQLPTVQTWGVYWYLLPTYPWAHVIQH